MLATSTLRNCVIQSWLAFLAATLTDQFQASALTVAVFWFVGAGCVFLLNVWTGRFLSRPGAVGWRSAESLLLLSSIGTVITAPLIYVAPTLPTAFAACVLFCLTVGVSIAGLITVLMKNYADLRGPVMGLNATAQNVGIVFGTGVASIGLGFGGYVGLALTLVVVGLVALGVLVYALRVLSASPHLEPEAESEPVAA
jgi:MFS family permease